MKKIDVFHIGPQKAATTWLYECIQSHSQITAAKQDSVHYFDMFYHKGDKWYLDRFKDSNINCKLVDMTPSYLRSEKAAKRIAKYNPNAKIILCIRNPIERAFSHYWHEKSRNNINYVFSDYLKNYDLFQNWIETGFYAHHIEIYKKYFPDNNILIQEFDDLKKNPTLFLKNFLSFIGVEDNYLPPNINKKANVASPVRDHKIETYKNNLKKIWLGKKLMWIKGKMREKGIIRDTADLTDQQKTKVETIYNQDPSLLKELHMIYTEDVDKLQEITGKNYDHWKVIK